MSAEQFIGLTVFLTLHDAEQTQLRGMVKSVNGQQLLLGNVFFPRTSYVMDHYVADGPQIKDLQLVAPDYLPPVETYTRPPSRPPAHLAQAYLAPKPPQVSQAPQVPQLPPQPAMPMLSSFQNPMQPYQQYSPYGNYGHTRGISVSQMPQPMLIPQQQSYGQPPPPPPPQPATSPPKPVQPAAAAFEDPAIVSMTRKPSAPATPLVSMAMPPPPLEPQQPAAQPAPTPTRPSRAPAAKAAAAASVLQQTQRPSSNLQRKSSSKTASSTMVNKLVIPTASASSQPQSASTVLAGPARTARRESGPSSAAPVFQQQHSFARIQFPNDPDADSDAVDFDALEETDDGQAFVRPPQPVEPKFTGKRSRRGKGSLKKQHEQQSGETLAQDENAAESRVVEPGMFSGAVAQAAMGKVPKVKQRGVKTSAKRSRKYRDHTNGADEDGWATEDVTDFKSQDFDFQSNLDRFDKKTVFSQIRAEDTTADEDRLVSFNRLPNRSGSAKQAVAKKNYHHTENVLGNYANGSKPLADRDGWQSPQFLVEEPDESDTSSGDDLRGRGSGNLDSGRNSRHAMSRRSLSHRRGSTRQMSTTAATSGARMSLENLTLAHVLDNSGVHISSSGGGGTGTGTNSAAPTVLSKSSSRAQLRLVSSNRVCPVVSPLQMLDVEGIAENELGLTEDMMTENAGRGLAQVAIRAFGQRISATNHNALPVVLVFAGNHKSGARAIAAGRHLKNHHVRVMVCMLGLERGEEEMLAGVAAQLRIFRNAGGRVARWEELAANLKSLDAPPELIIDGMLGTHLTFEDLRSDDQATAFQLVQFANKGKASVLSVDVPSGIDALKGDLADIADTDAFHMRAKWVVCLGAPKTGLLRALERGLGEEWSLFVVDIGISNTAWRKYGTRRRHGVEFATEWVAALRFLPKVEEER